MSGKDANQEKRAHVTREVQEFYDTHPYPPPVEQLDNYRRSWEETDRRRADYHLHWPTVPYREDQTILVAGCGTSQAAKHALRQPAARVVGIDLSSTSLRETEALKHRHQLTNLELHQLAIERVHELDQRFDKIVCTGVLHHLADPDQGLRALSDVLAPNGAMHLMVYATYGRTGIYMLQEYCRRLGIGKSDEEIRNLTRTLGALPREHPMAHLLGDASDFRSKAGLADALLNPQDRAYTVPELFDFIDQAGLAFGRWVRQAPYLPHCGVIAKTPHRSQLCRLPPPEQYALVELLRGAFVRHSFIACGKDQPAVNRAIRFEDKHWLGYIPIRLPRTICIEERLPPGAAAVLINQSHTFKDLILPIDSAEKRLFDAIDGTRSIGEIISASAKSGSRQKHRERARTLFERLWQYDQVVFDASDGSNHGRGNRAHGDQNSSHDP